MVPGSLSAVSSRRTCASANAPTFNRAPSTADDVSLLDAPSEAACALAALEARASTTAAIPTIVRRRDMRGAARITRAVTVSSNDAAASGAAL
jgi:hypothetical protein